MLQLYIDGYRVNLSEDVTTDYYIKNPYFTNEGDFTLDIDLDMNDPQNAAVYNYLHRMDRVKRPARREAILRDERGILVRGQEVILETREGKAKIQIIGGTSELNYIMSDKKLQDLDLWSYFDDDEIVYVPVCALNKSAHADFGLMDSEEYETTENSRSLNWKIVNKPRWRRSDAGLEMSYDAGQPYFWAIVNRVITALGYTVGTNVIQTDARYSQMIMIHAFRSKYIADILPRWTVSEFFDEIQKFFNVIISVDQRTREVNVVHAWGFFVNNSIEVIDHSDVYNMVEKTFDQESDMTMVDYSAVHYAFTDKDVNKYAALPPSLEPDCDAIQAETVAGASAYDVNYNVGLWKAIEGDESFLNASDVTSAVEATFGDLDIYHQTFNSEDLRFVLWAIEGEYSAFKLVDRFGAKTSIRETATDVEMKIVPVRMASSPMQGNDSQWWQYPLPAVDGEASSYKGFTVGLATRTTSEDNINEEIKSGYEEETKDDRADVIFAAYYFGQLSIDWEDPDSNTPNGLVIPVASPDYFVQLHRLKSSPADGIFWKCARVVVLGNDTNRTMSIKGTHGMNAYTYSQNPNVDTSVVYTVQFRCERTLDIRQVFLIDNRKFYCKELKCNINNGKRSEIIEGQFFPVLESGSSEGGESVFYVTYNLSRVIVLERISSVNANEALHLDLQMEAGGSAAASIHGTIYMGNVDITASALTLSGRTATVDIANVTGDVFVKAWKA